MSKGQHPFHSFHPLEKTTVAQWLLTCLFSGRDDLLGSNNCHASICRRSFRGAWPERRQFCCHRICPGTARRRGRRFDVLSTAAVAGRHANRNRGAPRREKRQTAQGRKQPPPHGRGNRAFAYRSHPAASHPAVLGGNRKSRSARTRG